jgi:hypothetical protein
LIARKGVGAYGFKIVVHWMLDFCLVHQFLLLR